MFCRILFFFSLWIAPTVLAASAAAEPAVVTVAIVGDADSAAMRGAQLGIEEAERQARYFGFTFVLESETRDAPLAISGLDEFDELMTLVGPGRIVFNVSVPMRKECREGLFHIAPSDAMIEAARVHWRETQAGDPPKVEAWHSSLVKFAARDLNKRFRERFGEPMGSAAWSGWAAARSIGEAVLRTRSDDLGVLRSYLRGDFALDGQKGSALRFDAEGQLRHPLYFVDDDNRVVGETFLQDQTGDSNRSGSPGCPPDAAD